MFPVAPSPLIEKYGGEYTNAQVFIDTSHRKMSVMIQVKIPDKEVERHADNEVRVIGIDRGIKNIEVLSNNTFLNAGQLKSIKGRYRHNKSELQHAGPRSAHRKLRELNGRERRFMLNTNYVISRKIAELPFDMIVLEDLKSAGMRKKRNGRRFNTMLGSWSPFQLEQFVEYMSQDMNKTVVYVNPKHTSKICSKCGYIHKNNREGNIFHCLNCNFELHADLNSARKIGVLGKSEYFRLLSTSQSLRPVPLIPDSNKPLQ